MVADESDDLRRVAAAVRTRRTELGLSLDEAARRAGIAPSTWTRIEASKPARGTKYRAIERTLAWAIGSIDAILSGATPAVEAKEPRPDQRQRHADFITMIEQIWGSDLPDSDKVDHIGYLIDEYRAATAEAARRADRLFRASRQRDAS